jgi:hypothetical protein
MYQFKIIKTEDGSYRFVLGAIQMLIEDFVVNNGSHFLTNPQKAIAYFNINGNVYGVSNQAHQYNTAEAFYEDMTQQYQFLTSNGLRDHQAPGIIPANKGYY